MKIKHLFMVSLVVATLFSCGSTKDITYFQDLSEEKTIALSEEQQIKLMPGDKISIIVNGTDPKITSIFNLVTSQRTIGSTESGSSSGSGYLTPYTIAPDGTIDFPVLGTIEVAGLTRKELEVKIKNLLITNELVKDPIVIVEYQNLIVSVLGEVARPGRINVTRDRYTVLEAISEAGDLTIDGKRTNVTVLRQEGNSQHVYKLNLCNYEELVKSPAYYLKQGDFVYVEPNGKKTRESTVNGNTVVSTSFWLSLASFAMTITVLLFN